MKKQLSLLDYYKIGDQIHDTEFKRVGTIVKLSARKIKVKFMFSVKETTIHKSSFIPEFVEKWILI